MALEGDGSPSPPRVLSTIGRYAPPGLVVVVSTTGYASCGDGQVRTAAAATTDLAAVGRACIDPQHVVAVATLAEARKALSAALTEPGPWIVVPRSSTRTAGRRAGRSAPRSRGTAVAFKREMMNRAIAPAGTPRSRARSFDHPIRALEQFAAGVSPSALASSD